MPLLAHIRDTAAGARPHPGGGDSVSGLLPVCVHLSGRAGLGSAGPQPSMAAGRAALWTQLPQKDEPQMGFDSDQSANLPPITKSASPLLEAYVERRERDRAP